MRIRTLTTLLLAAPLQGCGQDSASPAAAQPNLTAEISGAVSSQYSDRASVYCGSTGLGGNELEMYSRGEGGESVNLRMPADIEPGSYPLKETAKNSGSADGIHFYYRADQRTRFDWVQAGQISFEAVPTAKGESFTGSVDATLADDDSDKTINIKLRFDFPTGYQSFDEC